MKNKITLVTGGTSGIGKEIVKELIEKDYKVITCYSNNKETPLKRFATPEDTSQTLPIFIIRRFQFHYWRKYLVKWW